MRIYWLVCADIARVAQLDRASDFYSEGQGFESSRGHQFFVMYFRCLSNFLNILNLPVLRVFGKSFTSLCSAAFWLIP